MRPWRETGTETVTRVSHLDSVAGSLKRPERSHRSSPNDSPEITPRTSWPLLCKFCTVSFAAAPPFLHSNAPFRRQKPTQIASFSDNCQIDMHAGILTAVACEPSNDLTPSPEGKSVSSLKASSELTMKCQELHLNILHVAGLVFCGFIVHHVRMM